MAEPSQDAAGGGPARVLEKLLDVGSDLPDTLKLATIGVVAVAAVVLFTQLTEVPDVAIWAIVLLVLAPLGFQALKPRAADGPGTATVDLRPVLGQPLTVGVLSFAELGTVGDEEAMGDGFAEELIVRLSHVRDLNVKPRHAMLNVKGEGLTTRQIAQRLRAHFLVEGSLRRHGDDLRVTAGVIQAWDEDHWRDQWTGTVDGLFELQTAVAEDVAAHLVSQLGGGRARALAPDEREGLRRDPAESPEANVAYMRARTKRRRFNNRRENAQFLSAERAFQEALRLDPDYVDAWSELGFLYLLRWETEGGSGWLERAAAAFTQVRHREPTHGTATAELGYIALVSDDVDRALALTREAAELHPRQTIVQNVVALVYMYLGFYESAVHVTERVTRLDPDYVYPPTNAVTCLTLAGDHEGALEWARRAREVDATAFIVWLVEGAAWFHRGRLDQARQAWERGTEVAPGYIDRLFEVAGGWILAAEGDVDGARALVARHRGDSWLEGAYDPYFISLCSLAGEHDLALDLLERQTAWGRSYRYLVGDRTLDPLRETPRFQALLARRWEAWTEVAARLEGDLPRPPSGVPPRGAPATRPPGPRAAPPATP